jgi:hypothetical protein
MTMRKIYIMMIVGGLSAGSLLAQQRRPNESTTLKDRQEKERQALKLKQKYARESLQNSGLPKAVRTQLKHELKREQRKLRRRQKGERQTLRDRERLIKLETKLLKSE